MTVYLFGINHQSASIAVRERLVVSNTMMQAVLEQIKQCEGGCEVVIVSTCNRLEMIVIADSDQPVLVWLKQRYQSVCDDFDALLYQYQGDQVLTHLIRVASGLDSMLLGEPQILGQMKTAYKMACTFDCVGSNCQRLFPAVFSAAKLVRHQSNIGGYVTSLAYLVMTLIQKVFSDPSSCQLLLVGASETNQLILKYCQDHGLANIWVANRSIDHAKTFCQAHGGQPVSMIDIPRLLTAVDVVVSATTSQLPIIGKGAVESAQSHRKYRPLLMVDLAVPRDVEAHCTDIEQVYLYNIDDLQCMLFDNKSQQSQARVRAEQLVEEQVCRYIKAERLASTADVIVEYRQQVYRLFDTELTKALALLKQGDEPVQVMQQFSKAVANKVMHQPTQLLREALVDNHPEKLDWMKRLYPEPIED